MFLGTFDADGRMAKTLMTQEPNDEIKLAAWSDLLGKSTDLFYVKDARGYFVDTSLSFANLQGFDTPEDLIGKCDADFVTDKKALEKYRRGNALVIEQGRTLHTDPALVIGPDGIQRYYTSEVMPIRGRDGEVIGTFGVMLDVTYEEVAKSVLNELSESVDKDPMTGLLNHNATFRSIDALLKNAQPNEINAMFMIDIDNFKSVNDTLGHQMGDKVICDFARSIAACFRSDDIVGRIGGDEFLVMMRDIRTSEDIRNKAAQLVSTLQYTCETERGTMTVSASVGVSVCGGVGCTIKDLYSKADNQLYRSKLSGKSQYFIDGEDSPHDADSIVIENSHAGRRHAVVHLQSLLDNMAGFILICEVTDSIRFIYASPTATIYMRGTVGNGDGTSDTVLDSILPEDREMILGRIKEAAQFEGRADVTYRAYPRIGDAPVRRRAFGSRLPNPEGATQVMFVVEDLD